MYNTAVFGKDKVDQILMQLPEKERHILTRTILDAEWYPAEIFVHWLEQVIKLNYAGSAEEIQKSTGIVVEGQLKGIYKAFLTLGSAEGFIDKVGKITQRYYESLDLKVEKIDTGKVKITYSGLEKQYQVLEHTFMGWWIKALELMKAKNGKVEITTSVGEGKGYLELLLTWDKE